MAHLPKTNYGTEDFILGMAASTLSKTLAAPLDRAKLLLQCQHEHPAVRNGTRAAFTGLSDVLTRVPREHGGVRALWRGHMSSLVRVVPTLSLNLVLGETFRSVFTDPLGELGLAHSTAAKLAANTAAGGLAAAVALSIVYPLDVARTRLALDLGRSSSLLHGTVSPVSAAAREFQRAPFPWGRTLGLVRDVAARKGWVGPGSVFHGFSLAVTGAMVYRGMTFGLYRTFAMDVDETLQEYAQSAHYEKEFRDYEDDDDHGDDYDADDGGRAGGGSRGLWARARAKARESLLAGDGMAMLGFWAKFTVGYCSAAVASLAAYPWDTVMRRVMMNAGAQTRHVKYRHGRQCLRRIVSQQGVAALYNGASVSLLRSFSAALVLVGFDYVQAMHITQRRYGRFGDRPAPPSVATLRPPQL